MLRFLWVHQKVLTKKANALNVKSLHSFPIAFFVAQFLSLFSFRCFPFALFNSLFPFSTFFRFSTIDLSFSLFSSKISLISYPLERNKKNLLILVQLGKTDTLVCKNACLHWGPGMEIYVSYQIPVCEWGQKVRRNIQKVIMSSQERLILPREIVLLT